MMMKKMAENPATWNTIPEYNTTKYTATEDATINDTTRNGTEPEATTIGNTAMGNTAAIGYWAPPSFEDRYPHSSVTLHMAASQQDIAGLPWYVEVQYWCLAADLPGLATRGGFDWTMRNVVRGDSWWEERPQDARFKFRRYWSIQEDPKKPADTCQWVGLVTLHSLSIQDLCIRHLSGLRNGHLNMAWAKDHFGSSSSRPVFYYKGWGTQEYINCMQDDEEVRLRWLWPMESVAVPSAASSVASFKLETFVPSFKLEPLVPLALLLLYLFLGFYLFLCL